MYTEVMVYHRISVLVLIPAVTRLSFHFLSHEDAKGGSGASLDLYESRAMFASLKNAFMVRLFHSDMMSQGVVSNVYPNV